MKFYVEILHPYEKKVLWHYWAEGPSEESVRELATKKFIEEQTNGILLETGGLFLVTVEEEK